ncbi:hypothetical protein [Oceanithermus sp.]
MLLVFGELFAELSEADDGRLEVAWGGPLLRQARAARARGARVRVLGRVGRDGYGRAIKRLGQESGLEWVLQEDGDHPTGLLLHDPVPTAYRAADAQLEPPSDGFFEGGRLLHAGSWVFGLDPARTTASEIFREGLRRGLVLSLDLRAARWAFRAPPDEVLRPFLPLGYMKVDDEATEALGMRPGELVQWAGQVVFFTGGEVHLMSLFDERRWPLPAGAGPDEVYGRFLAGVTAGREPEAALEQALEAAGDEEVTHDEA